MGAAGAGDTQLGHARLEGCAFHPQACCGAVWSGDDPISFVQGAQDVIAFRGRQRAGVRADVLQQATACRGALDGFIAEVIEDHIREHMIDPRAGREAPQVLAAEELIEIVHQYLKK